MKNLVHGNIYKTFFLFALPMILSGVFSQAMGIVNTLIAGRFLGETGLAATGSTGALVTFCSSAFWGFSTGFGVYIARLFGAREYEDIRLSVRSFLCFITALTLSVSLLCFLLHRPLLNWLRVDPAVRTEARTYLLIYMSGFALHILSFLGVTLLNALGISGFPFAVSLISSAINVGGNLLTVAVLDWGVAGIAVSSVLASAIASVCYLRKIKACYREMQLERRRFRFSFSPIRRTLPYTVPTMLQQITMYVANLVLAPIVNGIGSAASAAYVVVQQITNLNASVYQNSSKTLSNYAAQCLGCEQEPQVQLRQLHRGLRVGLLQGILLALPILALCILFPNQVVFLFLRSNGSGEISAMLLSFIRIYLPFILFNLLNNLFHSLYRGVRAMKLLLISTAIGGTVRIVASLVLTARYAMNGFYAGWAVSWIAEALFCALVYACGIWIPEYLRQYTPRRGRMQPH